MRCRSGAQRADLLVWFSRRFLPDITIDTAADDFFPIEQMHLMRFDGEAWRTFGEVITGEVGH